MEKGWLCWKCSKSFEKTSSKLGFRESCPFCFSDLHCCINCKFYQPGKPNDCLIPNTEFVRDKEKANFCEDFQPLSPSEQKDPQKPKNKFNSLFKDP